MVKSCIKCRLTEPVCSFSKQSRDKNRIRNVCNSCIYNSRKSSGYLDRNKEIRSIQTQKWKKKNPTGNRYRSMRSSDKKRGHIGTMSREEYNIIIANSCHYCGSNKDVGVDRIDNNLGHTLNNSLPCCPKCNFLLCDLPMEAKDILKESLTKINTLKIIEEWVVPTQRRLKRDQ